jgi:hypothetical protein
MPYQHLAGVDVHAERGGLGFDEPVADHLQRPVGADRLAQRLHDEPGGIELPRPGHV